MRALLALLRSPPVRRVRRRTLAQGGTVQRSVPLGSLGPIRHVKRLATDDDGQGVPEYALVTVVFVTVLIVVLAALGDSIGVFLQGLVDQLPFGI